ncbi:MAG: hypothetical protein KF699_05950 [Phycisphaeraceae bacterium]|nr:hypothetical protein [Phycisphaeraceae bacterium]
MFNAVERAAKAELSERCIYTLSGYAWDGPDSPNPDYWGLNARELHGYSNWLRYLPSDLMEGPINRRPTDNECQLAGLEEDFVGFMRLALTSIGICVVTGRTIRDPQTDFPSLQNDLFVIHGHYVLVALAASFDRLFQISGFLPQNPPPANPPPKRTQVLLSRLRENAKHQDQSHRLVSLIDRAEMHCERLQRFLDARNNLVHDEKRGDLIDDFDTPESLGTREMFKLLISQFETGRRDVGPSGSESHDPRIDREAASIAICRRVDVLCDAYRCLVELANAVFAVDSVLVPKP